MQDESGIISRAVIIVGMVLLIIYGLQFYAGKKPVEKEGDFIRTVANTFTKVLGQAHQEWQKVGGGSGVSLNFLGLQADDIILNAEGWPNGASDGNSRPQLTFESLVGNELEEDKLCAQLFNNLLVNTTVRAGVGKIPCNADFCALATPNHCKFYYNKSPDNGFSYKPVTGSVESFFMQQR